jgi:flagellar biosynthetic protein FliQ
MLGNTEILQLASQSLSLVLTGSLPSIAAAAVAGVAIALFQALTQIQDQGLPTAVKFFGVLLALMLTYVSTATTIGAFAKLLFGMIEKI